jgi:hypothetical protein
MFADGQTRGCRPRLRQVRSALELRTKSEVTLLIALIENGLKAAMDLQ